jgi:hypothetical protein
MPMRAKVVIPLLLVGIITVLLVFVARPKNSAARNQPAQVTIAASDSTPKNNPVRHLEDISNFSPARPEKNLTASEETTNDSTNAENVDYEVYVVNRITELENLGMTDDPNSLAEIESEFDNRDQQIQKAAVAAAVQFGNRDAIPALQDAYRHFDDPEQKVNIQKAIDFLELPTMAETANATTPSNGGGDGN